MGLHQFSNNFRTLLTGAIGPTDVDIPVLSTVGLPEIEDDGDYFFVTLQDEAGNIEILKITQHAGTMLTAVRGQDDTTARSWIPGDTVEHRLVAQSLRDIDWARVRSVANGLAPLNELLKVPIAFLPDELLTQDEGDVRYLLESTLGEANGVAPLNEAGIVADEFLPDYLPESWLAALPPEPEEGETDPIYRVAPLERYQELDEEDEPVGDPRPVVPLAFMHPDVDVTPGEKIPLAWLGEPGVAGEDAHDGVAPLNVDGLVPDEHLPTTTRAFSYTISASGRDDLITTGTDKMSFYWPFDAEDVEVDFTLRSKDSGTVAIEVWNTSGVAAKIHTAALEALTDDLIATAVPVTQNAGVIAKDTPIRIDFTNVTGNDKQVIVRFTGKRKEPAA